MKILFWLRKAKQNKVGTCPVYCRITIEGLRSPDFSTSVRVFPQDWDAKNQKIKGNTTATQLANATLNEIRNRLHLLYLDLTSKQKPFTARTIYELYHQKEIDVSLKNCVEGYFADVVSQKSLTSQKRIKHLYKNIEVYFKSVGYWERSIKELQNSDVEKLFLSLEKRKFSKTHIWRHWIYFREMLRYSYRMGYLKENIFEQIKVKKCSKPVELIYLEPEELASLENFSTDIDRLAKVRDLFVFACYTGLSYSDLVRLKRENFYMGFDGRQWLYIKRGKTGAEVRMPVVRKALGILERYGYKLPVLSNQRYNGYLKELSDLCGIRKRLTTHVARKTFCVMALNDWGLPVETVQVLAGHKKLHTTMQYYTRVLERKISSDMAKIE